MLFPLLNDDVIAVTPTFIDAIYPDYKCDLYPRDYEDAIMTIDISFKDRVTYTYERSISPIVEHSSIIEMLIHYLFVNQKEFQYMTSDNFIDRFENDFDHYLDYDDE